MTDSDRQYLYPRLSDQQAAQLTVWGEARNQPITGIVAVLSTFANRLGRKASWDSLKAVCLASYQYSCWNADDPNYPKLLTYAKALITQQALPYDPALEVCGVLAQRLVDHQLIDPTGGATHYYNPAIVAQPTWARVPAERTTVIGAHAFYTKVAC